MASDTQGFAKYEDSWQENARLAWDTIRFKAVKGIPSAFVLSMGWDLIEELSGHPSGEYPKKPEEVYRDFQLSSGTCQIDQWIPRNPLTMTSRGYDSATERKATTGLERLVLDGIVIDSPEAVAEHLEGHVFPALERQIADGHERAEENICRLIDMEVTVQEYFGMNMLKVPYHGFQTFPTLRYPSYGYENYFMAYALFPDLIERDFELQADLAIIKNQQAAQAIVRGGLPPLLRLDHDMADSRGTLVDITTLDRIWFPHFERSIQPFLDADIRPIWHCDGNLMQMVPRLISCGVSGFQGFQYEDGMDYESICRMSDRDGDPLMIWAGVSVTTTLPHGTESDVKREIQWLVDNGPAIGMFLAPSSSIVPGTRKQNVKTMIEGFEYYREHGRGHRC